jgi:hypothetical protein
MARLTADAFQQRFTEIVSSSSHWFQSTNHRQSRRWITVESSADEPSALRESTTFTREAICAQRIARHGGRPASMA